MRYRILGPLEARTVVDHPALRRRKPRAVLAVLLLHANEVVSTDVLIDALWPERAPPKAAGSLQNFVSQLRKALGEGHLETRPPGYLLRVEPDELDVVVFERLVAEAREGPATQRRERLASALALWRGAPLEEFTYEPFAQAEITRLEELRLAALEQRIDADLELGRHAEVIGELESLVAQYPLREHLRALLMLALYRSGRQAEALEVYRDGHAILREELGLEPGAQLRQVERSILAQAEDVAAPAAAAAPSSEPAPSVRKVVTVVFADVTGSTRLASSLDPESLRAVLARFFAAMRAVVEEHGGTVEKISGDEVMAVFGVPAVHEDDGIRALRAAAGMHDALERLNELLEREHGLRLELRIGVNTGEVVTGDERDTPLVTGEAVSVGKRIQEAASPGDVLIGPLTRAVVLAAAELEPVGPVALRGRPEPLPAYRLVRLIETGAADGRDHSGTLVGRREELARLRSAYEHARGERTCSLAVVVGDAGIGKTRLARELTAGVAGDAQVLVGRCVSYGQGATYLPLVEVVRQATRDTTPEAILEGEPDAEQLAYSLRAALVGDVDAPLPAGEASLAVRRLLETLSRRSPVVLVLEDLHWAEPTLLDLVEQLVERSADAPLLVLAVARPELAERRPHWVDDTPDRLVVRLEPLADEDAEELVTTLAGETVEAVVRARVIEIAEGNPLFAEQLLRLVREGGPEALESRPPTVEALLASRLDTLPPLERSTVERAAVIGRDFRRSELVALLPPERAALAEQTLALLTRAGFVRARRATASAQDAYAFHHVLIRDVAYGAVPKARRAELHEQLADWLVEHGEAPDEIVGYHLEQASRNLVELGSSVRRSAKLAADGGAVLGRAGVRALARGDSHAANNLLSRASSLLPTGDPQRLELLAELGVAQRLGGDLGRADQVLADAVEEAVAAGDRRLELRARVELAAVRLLSDPSGAAEELTQLTESAIPVFEALGDDRALGRIWFLLTFLQGAFYCRNAAAEEAAERAVTHYRRARWSTASCLQGLASALFYGPRPAGEAVLRCDDLLAHDVTDRSGEAHIVLWRGALLALQGDFDAARASAARASTVFEELGQPTNVAASCAVVRGYTEVLAGNFGAAEAVLRSSAAELEERGEWAHLATRAAEVADAVHAQGRYAEALEWTDVARRHSAPEDISAEFTWRSARAKALAATGALVEAEDLGRRALELVETTDALNQRAHVRLDLSETLRLVGQASEAAMLADEAAALFELKGNVVGARRARSQRLTAV